MKRIIMFLAVLLLIVGCNKVEQEDFSDKVVPPSKAPECFANADCVAATCCHATECVHPDQAPNCEGVMCTMDCQPGTMDCGGGCSCEEGKCTANIPEI